MRECVPMCVNKTGIPSILRINFQCFCVRRLRRRRRRFFFLWN